MVAVYCLLPVVAMSVSFAIAAIKWGRWMRGQKTPMITTTTRDSIPSIIALDVDDSANDDCG